MPETPVIRSDDLPVLYRGASRQSAEAQRSFLRWFRLRLGGVVVAALGGALTWQVGHLYAGGAIAFLAFAVALGAELILALRRPDEVWYESRAAAESVKTRSWLYMMRGESFETNVQDAEGRLLNEIRGVLSDLDALPARAKSGSDVQLTPTMRDVRGRSFDERRAVYLRDRIQGQQDWYAAAAERNEAQASRWTIATIALEFVGLIGGAVKAAGLLDIDLLGILATAAACATSWMQAKQYQNLARAYGNTNQELATMASEIEAVRDETVWPRFVTQVEEVISSEHTLWRASRGIRDRPSRGET